MSLIAQQATTAPWWGVAIIAGAFGVVGALIAFLSTYFSDKRKSKREEIAVQKQEMRSACNSLLTECTKMMHMADNHTAGSAAEVPDESGILLALSQVQTTAPESLVRCGERLYSGVTDYKDSVFVGPAKNDAQTVASEARRDFMNAVREEFGQKPIGA